MYHIFTAMFGGGGGGLMRMFVAECGLYQNTLGLRHVSGFQIAGRDLRCLGLELIGHQQKGVAGSGGADLDITH